MESIERVDVGGRVHLSRRVRRPSTPGPACPVVLLPGTGLTAADWDPVVAELAEDRATHAVDLRGHGDSDRPGTYSIALMAADVAGLLDVLGAPAVDLVGHSLGGLVACRVAAERPRLVRRIVLEDVGVPHRRPPGLPPRPAGELAFDWAVVEQVRPEIDDPDPGWPDVLRRIAAPTLVIGGGPTSHVPQEHVRELVQTLPDACLVVIEAGHLVHATEPERFSVAVRAFLDG
ncbi:alpha/beta fold hydrolase [Phycicoccus sonneratiae]|uniref:alpha/beta fold hydrolase n=1 Tax=Phycicoccus sonneratiae TaxID=2807628 RepID=UPI0027DD75D8|nr:alpha/beta fold hydrolase [Phycicoccus sonneraticus]